MLQVVSELVTEGPVEDLSKLTVSGLQQRLASLGLPSSGRKAALILRLQTRGPGAGAQPSTASREGPDGQAEEWEDVEPPSSSCFSAMPASEAAGATQPAAVKPSGLVSDAAEPTAGRKSKPVGRGGRRKRLSATAAESAEVGKQAAQPPIAAGGMEVNMEDGAAAELAAEGIELEQAGPAPAMPPNVRPGTGALDDVMSAEVRERISLHSSSQPDL